MTAPSLNEYLRYARDGDEIADLLAQAGLGGPGINKVGGAEVVCTQARAALGSATLRAAFIAKYRRKS